MRVRALFGPVAPWCHSVLPQWHHTLRAPGQRRRQRAGQVVLRAIITLLVSVHQLRVRALKT